MRIALTAAAMLALASAGCARYCTDELRAAISVRVVDDATGAPITSATVVAVDGPFLETLELVGDGTYVGAYERGGRYTVTITAPAHVAATIAPFDVHEGECHVITRAFDVRLPPS